MTYATVLCVEQLKARPKCILMSRSALSLLTFYNSNSGANLIDPDLMPVTQGSKVDVFKEVDLMIAFTFGMQTDRLTD